MQPSGGGDEADYADQEAAEMGRILVRGAAVGVPLVFVISLVMVFAAGAHGAGAIFVAAWAALIGGTFIGAGILLSKRLGALGTPQRSVEPSARSPRGAAVSSQPPAGAEPVR